MNKRLQQSKYRISILGCGWLGLPLAAFFITQNMVVKGSTPSIEKLQKLKQKGVKSFLIDLSPDINSGYDSEFFNSDILIVNFPPKRRDDIVNWHTQQTESLISAIKSSVICKVIFISSTSVYANVNNDVNELNNEIPSKNSGKALRISEELFMKESNFRTTVIRFGGLIGYDRKPGRFFADKGNLKNGDVPVNLIHRDDCIGIINHVITNDIWDETLNACCPGHPSRRDFYKTAAKAHNFEIPKFLSGRNDFKIINCDKLISSGYSFLYKNPLDCLSV